MLVPGKAATLHAYGTVIEARLNLLIKRALPQEKERPKKIQRRGAAAMAELLGVATVGHTVGPACAPMARG